MQIAGQTNAQLRQRQQFFGPCGRRKFRSECIDHHIHTAALLGQRLPSGRCIKRRSNPVHLTVRLLRTCATCQNTATRTYVGQHAPAISCKCLHTGIPQTAARAQDQYRAGNAACTRPLHGIERVVTRRNQGAVRHGHPSSFVTIAAKRPPKHADHFVPVGAALQAPSSGQKAHKKGAYCAFPA